MSAWEALVLGLIQGLTEFLPVSSSGHLVVAQALLGIRIPGVAFEVAVHVGTLLSVLIALRSRVSWLFLGMLRLQGAAWRYGSLLVLATIPAVVVGLGAQAALEGLFERPVVPGIGLLVTGGFLLTARRAASRAPSGEPGIREALFMGVAQAFAIVPGISRSGATVVTGLWMGVEAEEAATFSFLMAVPAILGAAVLELPELLEAGGPGTVPLLLGSVVAAVAGILAIRTFIGMLKRKSFHRFGPYCLAVGLLFLLYLVVL